MFEKSLPFTLALDVEQRWAEQFASSIGNGFSNVISASAIAPGQNSGLGGGGGGW